MKVLLITPTFYPDVGGVETMLTNLCLYLTRRHIYTDVITFNPLIVRKKAPYFEKLSRYITVHRIPHLGFGLFNLLEHYPFLQFLYLVPVLTVYVLLFLLFHPKNKYHIVHSFGLSGATAAFFSSRIFNLPCLVDMCTVYRFPQRPLLAIYVKNLFSHFQYIRANSPVGKDELLTLGLPSSKIGIITPPVDQNYFRPLPSKAARQNINLPASNFTVLFAARMVESKNVKLALDSIKYIKSKNMSFVFVGEGPLQHLVENASQKDSRIIFRGNVSHQSLLDYYNAADVLTCAAVDAKLLSFVGREALLCGLPILYPDKAVYFNIPYTVSASLVPRSCGSIFKSNPKSLAIIINRLYGEYKLSHRLRSFSKISCRRHALSKYSNLSMKWIGNSYKIAIKNYKQI